MKIEIWSDVVCPWCYVGKRRFEKALARFAGAGEVEIEYRAYELDPSPGRDKRQTQAQMLAAKFGQSVPEAERMLATMTKTAAGEGLAFDFATVVGANRFRAHQVIALAADRAVQGAVTERLLKAHFEQGLDVEDVETLATLGASAGLDADEIRAVLADERYAETVRTQEEDARRLGITAVPFFVFDRKYGVSGAQPPEVFLEVLEKAAAG